MSVPQVAVDSRSSAIAAAREARASEASCAPPLRPVGQSRSDPAGRVFEGDGRIFRGIRAAYAGVYTELLASPAISDLFARGLVATEVSSVRVEDYPLVLEHRRVPFRTEWHEWPSYMLRDAAIALCDLNAALIRLGYGLYDLHPWNVLFDACSPVYVDFAAVAPLPSFRHHAETAAATFWRYWVVPLTLMAAGLPGLARSVSRHGDYREPLDAFICRRPASWLPLWYTWLSRRAASDPLRFFTAVKRRLERLRLAPAGAPRAATDDVAAHGAEAARAQIVRRLLRELRPATLFDVSCGYGAGATLAASCGCTVVALDHDEAAVNRLYLTAKAQGLDILPLVGDFSLPTRPHGRTYEVPAMTERLTSEATLALGVVQRLALQLGVPFGRVAQLLAACTSRYAIVEFAPPVDRTRSAASSSLPDWYTPGEFVQAMERHFRLAASFRLEAGRVVYLFAK
jgi:hypothetical protein